MTTEIPASSAQQTSYSERFLNDIATNIPTLATLGYVLAGRKGAMTGSALGGTLSLVQLMVKFMSQKNQITISDNLLSVIGKAGQAKLTKVLLSVYKISPQNANTIALLVIISSLLASVVANPSDQDDDSKSANALRLLYTALASSFIATTTLTLYNFFSSYTRNQ